MPIVMRAERPDHERRVMMMIHRVWVGEMAGCQMAGQPPVGHTTDNPNDTLGDYKSGTIPV